MRGIAQPWILNAALSAFLSRRQALINTARAQRPNPSDGSWVTTYLPLFLKFALTALGSKSQRLSTTDLRGFHWGARRLPRRHRARALAHIPERAS